MSMNKNDLVYYLSKKNDLSMRKNLKIVNDLVEIITLGLLRGEEVLIKNLGKFWVDYTKNRVLTPPNSRQKLMIPAHFLPKFKVSKGLKCRFLPKNG